MVLRGMPWTPRLIVLSHDGTCDGCGRRVARGDRAWWVRGKTTVTCTVCRPPVNTEGPGGAGPTEPMSPLATPDPDRTAGSSDRPAHPAEVRDEIDHGVAGRSALAEFQRRHDQREHTVRERWGRLAGLVLALSEDPQSTRAWQRGSVGESKVAQSLAKLGRDDIITLNDRLVPGSQANLDHLVVCPTGVFVVDTKRYTGEVRVRDVGGFFSGPNLRLYVGSHDCTDRAVAMEWQVAKVQSALGEAPVPVRPVLCFVDAEWPLFGGPDEFRGVLIEGPRSLRRRVGEKGPLDLETVREAALVLAHRFPPHP